MISDKPVLPPAFADMMLGRLATWLRLIGADVAYSNDIDDEALSFARKRNTGSCSREIVR